MKHSVYNQYSCVFDYIPLGKSTSGLNKEALNVSHCRYATVIMACVNTVGTYHSLYRRRWQCQAVQSCSCIQSAHKNTINVQFAAILQASSYSLSPVYSDKTQLDVELSCIAINGALVLRGLLHTY